MMKVASFAEFFFALWGKPPFDWQSRLLERVVEQGWPSTLDLPTGVGKTAALDIAVFALALDATRPREERRQARRIVLVVDRRVVVDQAFDRAAAIARKLADAREGILMEVAEALRKLSGDMKGLPLLPAILRGGMPRESEWAKSPSQPVILTSTVDQVGSRLLFRGYGVSEGMRPVHAGLLGCDTLILLDEVHLARPFEETLAAISRLYSSTEREGSAPPLQFVRMSATVANPASDTFGLIDGDRQSGVLSGRLKAQKVATLRLVNTPRDPAKTAEAIAKAALREIVRLSQGKARAVGVIVNRVNTAKSIAKLAQEALAQEWTVSLLTGRMRSLDRLENQAAVLDRVMAGRKRTEDAPKLLLVSTQAIEAGADFDFDALVTECASLDALRQRFGRLDRLGELGVAEAVVLACSSTVDEGAEADPIYGRSLAETWRFLTSVATPSKTVDAPIVDLGIDAMGALIGKMSSQQMLQVVAPRAVAPILTASHLDRWVQTSPAPLADPDVGPFLHGVGQGAPEVQVVWRADIVPEDLTEEGRVYAQSILELVRPSALEALSVPLWAARQWLGLVRARAGAADASSTGPLPGLADVEGAAEQADERVQIAPALVWQGGDVSVAITPEDLRPNQVLVVPSTYGGLDSTFACWDPDSTAPVNDRGDEAQLLQRGRAIVRWHPAVTRAWLPAALLESRRTPQIVPDEVHARGAAAEQEGFVDWASLLLSEDQLRPWTKLALSHLLGSTNRTTSVFGGSSSSDAVWRAQVAKRRVPSTALRELLGIPELRHAPIVAGAGEAATEEDEGSFLGSAITLKSHLKGVGDIAQSFAGALNLPRDLVADLALSGWIHDLGKADSRFQLWLHGGDEVKEAAAPALLAKSDITVTDRDARQRALERSGYPKGMRHELLSVALVQKEASVRSRAKDWDLVLHLVASHHGWCRPFSPPVLDPDPRTVSLEFEGVTLATSSAHDLQRFDSGTTDRFWTLLRRYGYWGLAWLEAVLRLADHRESERAAGGANDH